jgi:hypothetical protein
LSSTATPRARSSSSSRAHGAPAGGSSALVGSSSSSSRGEPIIACAIPSRCCMPFDIAPTGARPPREPDELEQLAALGRAAVDSASRWCSASSSSAVCHSGSGTARRGSRARVRLGEPAGRPRLARARRRPHEPAGDLHERRLARPFGPSSPNSSPSRDLEADARAAPRAP